MPRLGLVLPLALVLAPPARADWPQFRGPTGQGHADADNLPTEWSPTKNVAWKRPIPGLGWSSPVIAGGKVYLTTAVPAGKDFSLRTLCLDAATGTVAWNQEVFKQIGTTAPVIHAKNSHASPTPVVDGDRLYVHFGHMGTACLNTKDGSKVWATREVRYDPVHGNGGSPVLAGDRLVFTADGGDTQRVIALDKNTGKVAWEVPRNVGPKKGFSFCTPLAVTVNGRDQLVCPGSDIVMSLDPKTGAELWRVRYAGYSVVPKPVFGHGLVYLTTGYETPTTLYAIRPDGKGDVTDTHVAWTAKKNVPQNPSPLLAGDALYMVSDNGMLSCLDAKTGAERWTERVGGAFSASPVLAGGLVYLLAEDGTATVFRPGASYDPVATNKMGERALASYAVAGRTLFLRTEKALYRIEQK